jgi:glycerol-3-phosphate acyltransferase PlsY
MDEMNGYLIAAAAAGGYLLGAISFARLIGGIVAPGEDVTRSELVVGMEEKEQRKYTFELVSASTVGAKLGTRYGCLISVLDMLKVLAPTLAFRLLFPDSPYYLISAAAGVVGHNWPVYYRFKGGAGLSAALGGLLVIDWLGVLVAPAAGMIIGLFILRDVFASASVWLVLLIPWLWLRTNDVWHIGYAVVISISFLLASIPAMKQFYRIKREDPEAYRVMMESSKMFRGMLKISRWLGLERNKGH